MGLPFKPHYPRWLKNTKVSVLTELSHLKVLWRHWDLRSFIILSLCLQVILIFIAPFRKKTGNFAVISVIWLAYLFADYVAIQAVGLIPKYSNKTSGFVDSRYDTHPDLLAFWAPFLLVHLGGPDPITALALEDNELWLRTFLHLCTYGFATARVFVQSLPSSALAFPTFFMFVTGILKYFERTLSLYSARLTQFKSSMLDEPDPGPNYAKLMESYDSYLKSSLPAKFDTNPEPDQYNVFAALSIEQKNKDEKESDPDGDNDLADDPPPTGKAASAWEKFKSLICLFKSETDKNKRKALKNVKLVRDAYDFYEKFKGLYVDLIFTFHQRNESRTYFLKPKLTAEDAFTLIEAELNFTYEVFYTKMIVIHQTRGFWMRLSSSSLQVISLLIWILLIGKDDFRGIDIGITYTLLVGAIVIDLIAFVMVNASDWQLAMLNKESQRRASWYDKLLSARKRTWGGAWGRADSTWKEWTRRVLFRRWSESISQFNLIRYRVDPWSTGMKIFFKVVPPLKEKFEGFEYVTKTWFPDPLRNFIYEELRYKSAIAEEPSDATEICESKGDWVLRSLAGLDFEPFVYYQWTCDVEYDECLLLWHIATELLYQDKDYNPREEEKGEIDYRKFSKTLSDYMMYLLVRQPVLMLGVAGISDVRFRDTCAEATIFFDRVLPKRRKDETIKDRIITACKRMMDVNTTTPPKDIKGDRSKSVLFDAVQLAKKLREVKDTHEKKGGANVGMWELMAKVWVELMSYAATHTRASAHAAQLKQGGELLTLVWLLMFHLGLGKQFRITQGNARSKLIISK